MLLCSVTFHRMVLDSLCSCIAIVCIRCDSRMLPYVESCDTYGFIAGIQQTCKVVHVHNFIAGIQTNLHCRWCVTLMLGACLCIQTTLCICACLSCSKELQTRMTFTAQLPAPAVQHGIDLNRRFPVVSTFKYCLRQAVLPLRCQGWTP